MQIDAGFRMVINILLNLGTQKKATWPNSWKIFCNKAEIAILLNFSFKKLKERYNL